MLDMTWDICSTSWCWEATNGCYSGNSGIKDVAVRRRERRTAGDEQLLDAVAVIFGLDP